MDIQVGDKITFVTGKVMIVTETNKIEEIKNWGTISKIERPKYEVVEEKKELLTEEEKEFLRQLLKFIDEEIICINKLQSNCEKNIRLVFTNKKGISTSYYLSDKYFQRVNFDENYKLKELGLEEN